MRFEPGEKIKVVHDGNLCTAYFRGKNGCDSNKVSYTPDGECHVYRYSDCYKYKPIESDEENNQQFVEHAQELHQYLEDGWKELIRTIPEIRVVMDKHEPSIVVGDGTIVIVPGIVEQRGVGRITEYCGYTILTFKYHPATRHEPEDVEHIELSTVRGEGNAAQEAIKHLWLIQSDNYWTYVGERELGKQLAEEDHLADVERRRYERDMQAMMGNEPEG